MSPKSYQNAPWTPLSQLIETNRFRLVLHAQFEQPCGLSELPVELELESAFAGRLPFPVPWDKWLYGFVRINDALRKLRDEKQVRGISLHDWGDRFLMLLDTPGGEIPYFVGSDEVARLLADCLKPPELREAGK